ncbi:MAG: hypothetical protein RLZ98_1623 [Pseudomonadota bacterium]|jgi:glycerol-3-phosphate acyltransferase PlsY
MNALLSAPVLIALAAGYLLGSIPFGLILSRAAGLGDIRSIGSGNIGATNVLRTGNKALAAATLLLDTLKATAAVLLAKAGVFGTLADFQYIVAFAAGTGAFLGHLYPAWLGFKGGKGVATYIGALLGLYWPAAVAFCIVWLATAAATRYSSLSALVAALAAPIAVWLLGLPEIAILLVPISALLILRHRTNIERLMSGKEPRIGASH